MFNLRFFSSLLFCLFVHLLTFAQPANDDCSVAQPLTSGINCIKINGDLTGVTKSTQPSSNTQKDVWYSFVANTSKHYITISGGGNFQPGIELYSGNCGNTMISKGKFTSSSTSLWVLYSNLAVGQTYYFQVYNTNTPVLDNPNFTVCVQDFILNDECNGAIELKSNESCNSTYAITLGATQSQTGCQGTADDDVWFKFKATNTKHYITVDPISFSASGSPSPFNPVFEIFEGACGGLTSLKCMNAQSPGVIETFMQTGLTIGNSYYVRVYDSNGTSSKEPYFNICITNPPSNDDCTGAISVKPGYTCNSEEGDGTYATQSLAAGSGQGNANDDVWFKFIADTSIHYINIEAGTNYNPVVQVFSACSASPTPLSPTFYDNNSYIKGKNSSAKVIGLIKGNTYYYRVYDFEFTNPTTMNFNTCVTTFPINDECSGAITVTPSTSCNTVDGDGTYATQSLPAVNNYGSANDDVWFKFKAQKSTHFINVNASWEYDPVVEVFYGCGATPTPLSPAFINDVDYPKAALGYKVLTGLNPGTTYYYRVYDKSSTNPVTMTFKTCVTNPPTNDECIGAKLVNSGDVCDPELGKNLYATESVVKCSGSTGTAANDDIWFKFKAKSTSQFISVTPDDSGFDPVVELYSACSSSPTKFTPAFCEDSKYPAGKFGAGVVSGLTIGNEYYYRVYDLSDKNKDTMSFSTCVTNAVENDNCDGALKVNSTSSCDPVSTDALYASQSFPACATSTFANDDVWFKFTPTKTTEFISVTPVDKNYEPVVEVYSSCNTALLPKICAKLKKGTFDRVKVSNLDLTKEYFYRVYDASNTNPDTMQISTCVVESVVNDSCKFATPITISAASPTNGDGTYASMSLNSCTSTTASDDVWYTFTATATEKVNISVNASKNYNPVVQVFVNNCSTETTPKICKDSDFPESGFGSIQLDVLNGTTYYYRVYNVSSTKQYPFTFSTSVDRAPVNDKCANAINLAVNSTCTSIEGDVTLANKELNKAGCASTSNPKDVWYSFDATSSSYVIGVDASTYFDPVVEVYASCPGTTPTTPVPYKCEDSRFSMDGYGTVTLTGLLAQKYYYRIYNDASSGTIVNPQKFKTCVTTLPNPPDNDNPCSATLITPSTSCTYLTYTNEAATNSTGVPSPSCKSPANGDVWFKVKVPFSGILEFETKSQTVTELAMAVYKGDCNNLKEIKCDFGSSSNPGDMSKILLPGLTPGDTLRIRIWEIGNNNNGTFGLCVKKGIEPSLVGACTNLDFESGLKGWFGTYGGVTEGPSGSPSPTYVPISLNNLTQAKQFDLMTGTLDQYSLLPKIFQGSKTLRLGDDEDGYNNGRSIEQYFTVTSKNSYFVYNYAVVLDYDADGIKHQTNQQPFFKVEFFDDDGKQIGCGDYLVAVAGKNAKSAGLKVSAKDIDVIYSPWKTVGVQLTDYIGKNVHVRFTSGSCNGSIHFGYAYLDCACQPFEIEKPEKVCLGDTARLYAPKGGLSYIWKDQNGQIVGTNDSLNYKTKNAGRFKFTVDVTMFGTSSCQSRLETEIEVGPSPTLIITNPSAECDGTTVDITTDETTIGSTDNLTFSYWKDNPPTLQITDQATISKDGTYYIKGEKGPLCMDIKPVVVKINPTPKIADKTAIICSDDSVKLLPLLDPTDIIPADTKYKWTIDANSSNITGQSTESIGKSDIKNKLSNKVNTAQKIKYKITPFTPTCEGTPFYFEITVNPKPQIKDSTSSICTDMEFNIDPKNLSTNVVPLGTTYTWNHTDNTNVTNESNSATDETTIKSYTQKLINSTNTIQPVEHLVTPKSGTCVGSTFKVIINVNPVPTIPDSLKNICTNTTFNITPVHTGTRFIIPSGTSYTWTTPTLSGAIVGGSAQTNQTTISQTLINNTTANQTATYAITANSNTLPNCSSTFNGVITVEPKIKPVITCGTSSSNSLEFTWADIPGATSYDYEYKIGSTGTYTTSQNISAGTLPNRITSQSINGLSAGNNVYFKLTPVGILCPLPETKLCSNCAQPTIINTVPTTPTDFEICIGETITLKASEVPTNTNQWSILTNNIVSNTINSANKDLMDITGLKTGTTDIEFKNNTGCLNSISVTVNPKPEIAKIIKSICYGGLFDTIPNNNILTTNVVPIGTTYTWAPVTTVSNVTGITTVTSPETSFKQNLTNGTNVSKVIDYKVKATSGAAPNTCSNEFDVSVTLNPTPKIAPITKILCSTDAFDTIPNNTFLSTNIVPSGTTYSWDLPTLLTGINGAIAENTNTKTSFKQTLTNTTTNPINVSYTVTAKSGSIPDQCTSTFNTTLTVNPTPKIDNITLAICSGETFDTIPDNTNPNSIPTDTKYTWNITSPPTGISGITSGTNQSSIQQTLKNTTANPINVIYTITATSGVVPNQCSIIFTLTAKVNPTPKIISVDTIRICANIKSFNLNETGGNASSWEWSSNLSTSTANFDNKTIKNPTVENGIHGEAFKVIGSDINGCKDSVKTILKILPLPIFTPNVDTACVNGKLTFKAKLPSQINYPTYMWSYPDGTTTNPLESFQIDPVNIVNAGKYYITVTDVNSCSKKDSVEAIVNQLPTITTAPLEVCAGSNLLVKANHPAASTSAWTSSDPANATISGNGVAFGIKPDKTNLQFKDNKGCVTTKELAVNIKPVADFKAMYESICVTDSLFLIDKSKPLSHTYIWSFGDGLSSKHNAHKYLTGGIFDITLVTITDKGCMDTMTKNKYIEVTGLPKVTFSFTPDSIDIFEPEIRFTNHSDAKHYKWVFGDGLPSSVQENPTHTFQTTTGQHYTVTLTGYNTENGCSTSYSQIIVAKEPLIYYIPNTFTPNGDEYNNVFKPIFYSGLDVYNYHFIIYNRWGEVIFESFNLDFGWDGTYGNQLVETATFIWKLEFKEKNKENTHSKTGHVNIIK
jgi:gliding motility-associated-like protein